MKMNRHRTRFHFTPSCLLVALLALSGTTGLAQSSDDEVTPEVQRLYAQARAAQQQGDNPSAIEKYRAMIHVAPHLAAAYNNLGMLYFNEHDFSQAAQTLEKGLQLNPDMPGASAMLGTSYFEMGEAQKAEAPLDTALRANPNDNLAEMTLAKALIRLRKYDKAVDTLKHYTQRNARDQEAWYLLGKSYLQMSEDSLGKINEIDPNSVVAHEVAGEIDESMHNYDGALVEYKKAAEMAPSRPGTHLHLATAYWSISKWESARTEFEAELKNDPNNCSARWKLGNTILELNRPAEEALAQLNQAVERCPELMQARVDRARAQIKLGKQNDALPDLLMAEKDSPKEPSIHFLLASVYRSQGKTADAQQELRTYGRLQREASEAVAGQANESLNIKDTAH
jgi:tetratricopeptide (TPR) repeat protein